MRDEERWYSDTKVDRAVESFRKNDFKAFSVSNKEESVSKIMDLIPDKARIGIGDSVTVEDIGLSDILIDEGYEVADNRKAKMSGLKGEEMNQVRKNQLTSDVFISSTNALTETGELINIDSTGQRVASMIFGPDQVIIIAGINKIVENVDKGIERVRNVAAPKNAKRLNKNVPCAQTGKCSNCKSEDRICKITTIQHRKPTRTDTTIIIIKEKLGY